MYILLANQGHASVFKNDGKNKSFVFKKKFENKDMMQKDSKLFSDRAGVGQSSNTSNQVTLGQSHYREELVSKFSLDIVDYLSKLASKGELESLTLVCGPAFLGEFRKKIPKILSPLINQELSKNFYTEKPHELQDFVESHKLKISH
jgi:protein required for attachment to host cells